MIRVVIPGPPVAEGRGRAYTDPRGQLRVVTPEKTRAWKAMAGRLMLIERARNSFTAPLTGALAVTVEARFALPKAEERVRAPVPEAWHVARPDADNVAKAALDAGNGVLWKDDAQVVSLTVAKIRAAQGAPAGVVVTVERLEVLG